MPDSRALAPRTGHAPAPGGRRPQFPALRILPAPTGLTFQIIKEFYSAQNRPLPEAERIDSGMMPEPYQRLLVHSQDMTPTLERFFGQSLTVQVLQRSRRGQHYFREVTLRLSQSGKPVEYGVIKIDLNLFPEPAREAILAERMPLGRILSDYQIAHFSWPQAFFQVQATPHLVTLLGLENSQLLYGRRNLLLTHARRLLAEVIEILPSLNP
jgi:chorismate-pyruvate lyase